MTHSKLEDSLVFASAQQMLQRLVERGLITECEAESVRQDLRHRLRPTV